MAVSIQTIDINTLPVVGENKLISEGVGLKLFQLIHVYTVEIIICGKDSDIRLCGAVYCLEEVLCALSETSRVSLL